VSQGATPPPAGNQGTSVLVVEDEALIAMGITRCLASLGYVVRGPSATGEAAIELATADPPDVVLMDIKLSGRLTGVDTAVRLREHGLNVPIVFLTAYADPAALGRDENIGTFGYLVKPFEERELHATLQVAITRHRFERELIQANHKLEAALSKVRTLSGLIPLCSWCGKIRSDRHYWQSIEAYVAEHTNARVSHALCPECLEQRIDRPKVP
jgi:CheY-like chemotaxis protein